MVNSSFVTLVSLQAHVPPMRIQILPMNFFTFRIYYVDEHLYRLPSEGRTLLLFR